MAASCLPGVALLARRGGAVAGGRGAVAGGRGRGGAVGGGSLGVATTATDGALLHGQSGGDALHKEGAHLHLLLGVEGRHADVALGEGGAGSGNLGQNLAGVGAAEHGQLPHRPVTVVVVARQGALDAGGEHVGGGGGLLGGDLKAGGPAVANDVVDLARDLLLGQRGQEGEGLVHGVANGVPHQHLAGGRSVGHAHGLNGRGGGEGSTDGSHCERWLGWVCREG
mmetsp:Transcript_21111/g.54121  ORF Transcript_21111/g.54121 Transcript_21111/m.54121 type:complete len:225 (+) Transcript_21111:142-816(+)